jgi:type VI secretion system protein ImpA
LLLGSGLMNLLPVDDLLAPLSDAAPCGPDLEHDAAFMALDVAARGVPERQAGDTILPATPPAWDEVLEQALALAARTRDLRIAVLLTRSAARTRGIQGAANGLQLVAGLLERQWDHVHPRLDEDDGLDPTMRLNALGPLADMATGLDDLRRCAIGPARNGLLVRSLELAWGRAEPQAEEIRPTREGVEHALRSLVSHEPLAIEALAAVDSSAARIEAVLEARAPTSGPDLKPLRRLTQCLAQAAAQAKGAPVPADAGPGPGSEVASPGAVASGGIRSREDVVRVLGQISEWVERNEPSNPAPLLIRRAQRLMAKSFLDIVRDLAPEGLSQVERIAGMSES